MTGHNSESCLHCCLWREIKAFYGGEGRDIAVDGVEVLTTLANLASELLSACPDMDSVLPKFIEAVDRHAKNRRATGAHPQGGFVGGLQ